MGTDECVQDFLDMKMNKKHQFQLIALVKPEYKYLETSHLEPRDAQVKESNKECWEKMKNMLDDKNPLFIVFPLKWQSKEGGERGKLVFISWIPENCTRKEKMICATSKVYLKGKLEGVAEDSIHATEQGELDYCDIITSISKGNAII